MSSLRLRYSATAIICVTALLFAVAIVPAGAVTSSQQSPTVSFSPNPTAGSAVSVTVSGFVDRPSRLQVFADPRGVPCGTQPNDKIDDAVVSGGPFSRTSQFTPAQAGPYMICIQLSASTQTSDGTTTQTQSLSYGLTVAPAPPGTAASPAGPSATAAPVGALAGPLTVGHCRVPSLQRHTLRGARSLLAQRHCRLAGVYRPSKRVLDDARRHNHGRAPVLVVIAQNPRAGRVLPDRSFVAVRLGLRSGSRTHR